MKSDVWSFGVLLWEIFSYGKVPYPGQSNEDAAKSVVEGKVMEVPESCPPAIGQMMKECWNLTPEKRPDFSILVDQLATQVPLATRRTKEPETFYADYNINNE